MRRKRNEAEFRSKDLAIMLPSRILVVGWDSIGMQIQLENGSTLMIVNPEQEDTNEASQRDSA